MTSKEQTKLDALTALRFAAAFLVVLGHSRNDFICLAPMPDRIVFNQAVTFFFVLSGFILTYVYPKLTNKTSIVSFLSKRFARLWPLHAAVFAMHKALVVKALVTIYGAAPLSLVTAANLLMVHAWVPLVQFFFSYNAPSWSISTEFFFYLCFPLLLLAMRRAFWLPLLITGALVVFFISVANWLQLPVSHESRVSIEALVYINPLARIFEFAVGMVTALVFEKLASPTGHKADKRRTISFTILEVIALAFTGILMYCTMDVSHAAETLPFIGKAGACWLKYSGVPFIGFSLTVLVFAFGRGLIAKLLSTPPAVLLGDISYAVYLCHYPLLMYRRCFIPQANSTSAFIAFVAILLIVSHLFYIVLEKPARRYIAMLLQATLLNPRQGLDKAASWCRLRWSMIRYAFISLGFEKACKMLFRNVVAPQFKTSLVWRALEVSCLVLVIVTLHPAITRLSSSQAHVFMSHRNSLAKDISVGNGLQLETVVTRSGSNSTHLDFVWKSRQAERLHYYLFVHLLDEKGNKFFEQSANFAPRPATVQPGDLWLESISIPSDQLNKAQQVGLIVVKENEGLMPFSSGNTDMSSLRLLVPVNAILASAKRRAISM